MHKPLLLHDFMASIEFPTDLSRSFCAHCAIGIEPNKKPLSEHLGDCLMLVTALNPHIGYEKAAMKLGFLTREQFDTWVRPEETTHPLGGNQ